MKQFLKQTIASFKPLDIIIWSVSVAAILASFFGVKSRDYVTLAASLIGATMLIFTAKGNVIGEILTVVFAVFYGIVSFATRYYGEMITYLGMSAPAAIVAVVTWVRHPYNGNRTEVKVNTIKGKEWGLLAALSAVVTVAFYFILRAFGNASLITSTISVLTSFVASYLALRRSEYYAVAYAANDVVLVVLWAFATADDLQYLPMIVCFVVFLVNDIYGFVNWRRSKRRQARAEKESAGNETAEESRSTENAEEI